VLAVILLLVGGAVAVATLVLSGHETLIPFVPPKRAAFTFQMGDVSTTSLGGKHADTVGTQVAPQVQKTLSDLYGGLFLDPKAWSSGPPSDVYDHFTDRAVDQAKSDGAALGLGDLTGTIDTLKVESSNLEVHVLSDHANAPVAAVAKVQFVANATTKDGKHLKITRDAEYLMENVDGTWLVSGYPKNLLSVEVVTPSAGPSGTSGSGASS
jgi:hypothetical protein